MTKKADYFWGVTVKRRAAPDKSGVSVALSENLGHLLCSIGPWESLITLDGARFLADRIADLIQEAQALLDENLTDDEKKKIIIQLDKELKPKLPKHLPTLGEKIAKIKAKKERDREYRLRKKSMQSIKALEDSGSKLRK